MVAIDAATTPSESPASALATRALIDALHPLRPSLAGVLRDPRAAVAAARMHKVSAMLARALEREGALASLDAPARDALRRDILDVEFMRARLEAAAVEACDAFDAQGVPYLFLKGTAVSRIVHGDPALRPISDVDLLVQPSRFYDAMRALAACGFKMPTERQMKYWREAFYNIGVVSLAGAKASVEVHWSIAQRGRHTPDIEHMFSRAQDFSFNGRPARALGSVDLLLHQTLHHAYHYFEPKLMWICDLALIHRHPPDVDACRSRARAWGMSLSLALSILHLEKVFPGIVSPGFLRFASNHTRAGAIVRHFGSADPAGIVAKSDVRRRQLVLALLMLDGPVQAVRSVTSWAWRALRYGDRAGAAGELAKHTREDA